jgi:hypothetical protein
MLRYLSRGPCSRGPRLGVQAIDAAPCTSLYTLAPMDKSWPARHTGDRADVSDTRQRAGLGRSNPTPVGSPLDA